MFRKIISENPADKAEKPKVVDPKIRIITNGEQKSFLSVLHLYNAGNMFAFALATGMRIGGVCAMNIDDIDWKHNLMVINKTTSNTTTALSSGAAAHNIAAILGHKDGATTLRFYAHFINSAR